MDTTKFEARMDARLAAVKRVMRLQAALTLSIGRNVAAMVTERQTR